MVQAVVLLVREYSTRKTLIQKAAIAELLQIAGYGVEVGVMRLRAASFIVLSV